jgi:hypothetical protein
MRRMLMPSSGAPVLHIGLLLDAIRLPGSCCRRSPLARDTAQQLSGAGLCQGIKFWVAQGSVGCMHW